MNSYVSRRQFIQYAILGLSSMAISQDREGAKQYSTIRLIRETDRDTKLDINIPQGSTIRPIAQSGQAVIDGQAFHWHSAPDGGACFAAEEGGWIYVSNSEMDKKGGGVSAIRFNQTGDLIAAYSILRNTSRNCAGGKTPWNTWLSCEENGDQGQVYECDPMGKKSASVRPAMGTFNHEAATVDLASGYVYLTEDVKDGCLYRFQPRIKNDLSEGLLEVAVENKSILSWQRIEDPAANTEPTRYQVMSAARFRGGEGIIYHDRQIFFTTKKDNSVWCYHINTGLIAKVYAATDYKLPLLTGVDNIEVSHSGELLIAEDGGNMQIIALDQYYQPHVLVEVHGQDRSEITGLAFSPDFKRLYFSSQRGKTGNSEDGITYELTFS